MSLSVTSCAPSSRRQPARPSLTVPSAPSAISQGFQPALAGYRYHFPADGGAHPAYKTEWWYYTGHLQAAGREYGFELTFFCVGLAAHPRPRSSRWAASAIYLAHFAITDVDGRKFAYQERIDRGALGLAGADTGTEHVWIQDWGASVSPPAGKKDVTAALWSHHLQAAADFGSVDLTLKPLKPP
ncbi:MAG: carotenoid 1,2-hydratase, partial [Chloroflexi bacterium]|nr:carotenoid 1,2-hydratase [Chloroflexota bacterium]